MPLTYRGSGVDIAKGNKLVDLIKPMAKSNFKPGVLYDIGSFGAFFKLNLSKYKAPVLVSSTDGVGTKLKIASMLDRHDTVGIDLVAMCVNDILACGAKPIFFLDYFATGKLSTKKASDVIKGIANGCKMADCSLIGGETAEMPGFYSAGEYDLAGFSVGIVDRSLIIDGSKIKEGDVLIGIASNGLHSNGYSLARRLFFDIRKDKASSHITELGCSIGEALLKPTKVYVKPVLKIINKFKIKGMAHITGGGITDNLPRIFPKKRGLKAIIEKDSWPKQDIFRLIQREGNVSEDEMFRTFNMGIGYILVSRGSDAEKIKDRLLSLGEDAYIIGTIEKGRKGVRYI
jgi:phosphoribosylformylglycinamidine cyclo-ligase